MKYKVDDPEKLKEYEKAVVKKPATIAPAISTTKTAPKIEPLKPTVKKVPTKQVPVVTTTNIVTDRQKPGPITKEVREAAPTLQDTAKPDPLKSPGKGIPAKKSRETVLESTGGVASGYTVTQKAIEDTKAEVNRVYEESYNTKKTEGAEVKTGAFKYVLGTDEDAADYEEYKKRNPYDFNSSFGQVKAKDYPTYLKEDKKKAEYLRDDAKGKIFEQAQYMGDETRDQWLEQHAGLTYQEKAAAAKLQEAIEAGKITDTEADEIFRELGKKTDTLYRQEDIDALQDNDELVAQVYERMQRGEGYTDLLAKALEGKGIEYTTYNIPLVDSGTFDPQFIGELKQRGVMDTVYQSLDVMFLRMGEAFDINAHIAGMENSFWEAIVSNVENQTELRRSEILDRMPEVAWHLAQTSAMMVESYEERQTSAQNYTDKYEMYTMDGISEMIIGAAGSVGYMVPTLLAGLVFQYGLAFGTTATALTTKIVSTAAGLAPMGAQVYATTYNDDIQAGYDPETASTHATLLAALEVGTELINLKIGGIAMGKSGVTLAAFAKGLTAELAENGLAKASIHGLKLAFEEGGEEVVAALFEDALNQILVYNVGATELTEENRHEFTEAMKQDIRNAISSGKLGQSFILGALTTGMMGAPAFLSGQLVYSTINNLDEKYIKEFEDKVNKRFAPEGTKLVERWEMIGIDAAENAFKLTRKEYLEMSKDANVTIATGTTLRDKVNTLVTAQYRVDPKTKEFVKIAKIDTIGHELTHIIKMEMPEVYQRLVRFYETSYTYANGKYAAIDPYAYRENAKLKLETDEAGNRYAVYDGVRVYKGSLDYAVAYKRLTYGVKKPRDEIVEELVAEFIGQNLFVNTNFMRSVLPQVYDGRNFGDKLFDIFHQGGLADTVVGKSMGRALSDYQFGSAALTSMRTLNERVSAKQLDEEQFKRDLVSTTTKSGTEVYTPLTLQEKIAKANAVKIFTPEKVDELTAKNQESGDPVLISSEGRELTKTEINQERYSLPYASILGVYSDVFTESEKALLNDGIAFDKADPNARKLSADGLMALYPVMSKLKRLDFGGFKIPPMVAYRDVFRDGKIYTTMTINARMSKETAYYTSLLLEEGHDEYFDALTNKPVQLRFRIDEIDPRFQKPEDTLTKGNFTFAAVRVINQYVKDKIQVKDIRAILQKNLKKEEYRWTGLEYILNKLDDTDKITKDELFDGMARLAPRITVNEVTKPKWRRYSFAGQKYSELLIKLESVLLPKYFRNSATRTHWGNINNILAHIRVGEGQTLIDGKYEPVLFINELQSDILQQRRKLEADLKLEDMYTIYDYKTAFVRPEFIDAKAAKAAYVKTAKAVSKLAGKQLSNIDDDYAMMVVNEAYGNLDPYTPDDGRKREVSIGLIALGAQTRLKGWTGAKSAFEFITDTLGIERRPWDFAYLRLNAGELYRANYTYPSNYKYDLAGVELAIRSMAKTDTGKTTMVTGVNRVTVEMSAQDDYGPPTNLAKVAYENGQLYTTRRFEFTITASINFTQHSAETGQDIVKTTTLSDTFSIIAVKLRDGVFHAKVLSKDYGKLVYPLFKPAEYTSFETWLNSEFHHNTGMRAWGSFDQARAERLIGEYKPVYVAGVSKALGLDTDVVADYYDKLSKYVLADYIKKHLEQKDALSRDAYKDQDKIMELPYVDTWSELATKYAIDYAIKRGYRYVAIDTGSAQAGHWGGKALSYGIELTAKPIIKGDTRDGKTANLYITIKDLMVGQSAGGRQAFNGGRFFAAPTNDDPASVEAFVETIKKEAETESGNVPEYNFITANNISDNDLRKFAKAAIGIVKNRDMSGVKTGLEAYTTPISYQFYNTLKPAVRVYKGMRQAYDIDAVKVLAKLAKKYNGKVSKMYVGSSQYIYDAEEAKKIFETDYNAVKWLAAGAENLYNFLLQFKDMDAKTLYMSLAGYYAADNLGMDPELYQNLVDSGAEITDPDFIAEREELYQQTLEKYREMEIMSANRLSADIEPGAPISLSDIRDVTVGTYLNNPRTPTEAAVLAKTTLNGVTNLLGRTLYYINQGIVPYSPTKLFGYFPADNLTIDFKETENAIEPYLDGVVNLFGDNDLVKDAVLDAKALFNAIRKLSANQYGLGANRVLESSQPIFDDFVNASNVANGGVGRYATLELTDELVESVKNNRFDLFQMDENLLDENKHPGFYSELELLIQKKMQNRAKVRDIENIAKQVRKTEYELLLKPFLDLLNPDDMVEKKDVLDAIHALAPWVAWVDNGGDRYQDYNFGKRDFKIMTLEAKHPGIAEFSDTHFTNHTVLHERFTKVLDADGNDVLMLEEAQSDPYQAATRTDRNNVRIGYDTSNPLQKLNSLKTIEDGIESIYETILGNTTPVGEVDETFGTHKGNAIVLADIGGGMKTIIGFDGMMHMADVEYELGQLVQGRHYNRKGYRNNYRYDPTDKLTLAKRMEYAKMEYESEDGKLALFKAESLETFMDKLFGFGTKLTVGVGYGTSADGAEEFAYFGGDRANYEANNVRADRNYARRLDLTRIEPRHLSVDEKGAHLTSTTQRSMFNRDNEVPLIAYLETLPVPKKKFTHALNPYYEYQIKHGVENIVPVEGSIAITNIDIKMAFNGYMVLGIGYRMDDKSEYWGRGALSVIINYDPELNRGVSMQHAFKIMQPIWYAAGAFGTNSYFKTRLIDNSTNSYLQLQSMMMVANGHFIATGTYSGLEPYYDKISSLFGRLMVVHGQSMNYKYGAIPRNVYAYDGWKNIVPMLALKEAVKANSKKLMVASGLMNIYRYRTISNPSVKGEAYIHVAETDEQLGVYDIELSMFNGIDTGNALDGMQKSGGGRAGFFTHYYVLDYNYEAIEGLRFHNHNDTIDLFDMGGALTGDYTLLALYIRGYIKNNEPEQRTVLALTSLLNRLEQGTPIANIEYQPFPVAIEDYVLEGESRDGMRTHYDKVLVSEFTKLAKRYGAKAGFEYVSNTDFGNGVVDRDYAYIKALVRHIITNMKVIAFSAIRPNSKRAGRDEIKLISDPLTEPELALINPEDREALNRTWVDVDEENTLEAYFKDSAFFNDTKLNTYLNSNDVEQFRNYIFDNLHRYDLLRDELSSEDEVMEFKIVGYDEWNGTGNDRMVDGMRAFYKQTTNMLVVMLNLLEPMQGVYFGYIENDRHHHAKPLINEWNYQSAIFEIVHNMMGRYHTEHDAVTGLHNTQELLNEYYYHRFLQAPINGWSTLLGSTMLGSLQTKDNSGRRVDRAIKLFENGSKNVNQAIIDIFAPETIDGPTNKQEPLYITDHALMGNYKGFVGEITEMLFYASSVMAKLSKDPTAMDQVEIRFIKRNLREMRSNIVYAVKTLLTTAEAIDRFIGQLENVKSGGLFWENNEESRKAGAALAATPFATKLKENAAIMQAEAERLVNLEIGLSQAYDQLITLEGLADAFIGRTAYVGSYDGTVWRNVMMKRSIQSNMAKLNKPENINDMTKMFQNLFASERDWGSSSVRPYTDRAFSIEINDEIKEAFGPDKKLPLFQLYEPDFYVSENHINQPLTLLKVLDGMFAAQDSRRDTFNGDELRAFIRDTIYKRDQILRRQALMDDRSDNKKKAFNIDAIPAIPEEFLGLIENGDSFDKARLLGFTAKNINAKLADYIANHYKNDGKILLSDIRVGAMMSPDAFNDYKWTGLETALDQLTLNGQKFISRAEVDAILAQADLVTERTTYNSKDVFGEVPHFYNYTSTARFEHRGYPAARLGITADGEYIERVYTAKGSALKRFAFFDMHFNNKQNVVYYYRATEGIDYDWKPDDVKAAILEEYESGALQRMAKVGSLKQTDTSTEANEVERQGKRLAKSIRKSAIGKMGLDFVQDDVPVYRYKLSGRMDIEYSDIIPERYVRDIHRGYQVTDKVLIREENGNGYWQYNITDGTDRKQLYVTTYPSKAKAIDNYLFTLEEYTLPGRRDKAGYMGLQDYNADFIAYEYNAPQKVFELPYQNVWARESVRSFIANAISNGHNQLLLATGWEVASRYPSGFNADHVAAETLQSLVIPRFEGATLVLDFKQIYLSNLSEHMGYNPFSARGKDLEFNAKEFLETQNRSGNSWYYDWVIKEVLKPKEYNALKRYLLNYDKVNKLLKERVGIDGVGFQFNLVRAANISPTGGQDYTQTGEFIKLSDLMRDMPQYEDVLSLFLQSRINDVRYSNDTLEGAALDFNKLYAKAPFGSIQGELIGTRLNPLSRFYDVEGVALFNHYLQDYGLAMELRWRSHNIKAKFETFRIKLQRALTNMLMDDRYGIDTGVMRMVSDLEFGDPEFGDKVSDIVDVLSPMFMDGKRMGAAEQLLAELDIFALESQWSKNDVPRTEQEYMAYMVAQNRGHAHGNYWWSVDITPEAAVSIQISLDRFQMVEEFEPGNWEAIEAGFRQIFTKAKYAGQDEQPFIDALRKENKKVPIRNVARLETIVAATLNRLIADGLAVANQFITINMVIPTTTPEVDTLKKAIVADRSSVTLYPFNAANMMLEVDLNKKYGKTALVTNRSVEYKRVNVAKTFGSAEQFAELVLRDITRPGHKRNERIALLVDAILNGQAIYMVAAETTYKDKNVQTPTLTNEFIVYPADRSFIGVAAYDNAARRFTTFILPSNLAKYGLTDVPEMVGMAQANADNRYIMSGETHQRIGNKLDKEIASATAMRLTDEARGAPMETAAIGYKNEFNSKSTALPDGNYEMRDNKYKFQLDEDLAAAEEYYDVTLDTYVPPEGLRVRTHEKTIAKSGEVEPRTYTWVERQIISGEMNYVPSGDKDALTIAAQIVRQDIDAAYQEFESAYRSNRRMTKLDIAKAELMIVEMSKKDSGVKNRVSKVIKLISDLAALGTELGQAVQAMSLINKLSAQGQLLHLQRMTDRMNRMYVQNGQGEVDFKYDQDLVDDLLTKTDPDEIEEAVKKLVMSLTEQVPITFADKVNAWRYLAMLLNPRTHMRNIFGNVLMLPLIRIKDIVAVAPEALFVKKQDRTKALIPTSAARAFARRDYASNRQTILGEQKYSPELEMKQNRRIFKTRWLEALRRFNFKALELEDALFSHIHYVHAAASLITARGWDPNNLSPEQLNAVRNYGVTEAQKGTFRDFSELANLLNYIERSYGNEHKAVQFFIAATIPFKKTPINIVKRAGEYSPIGLIGAFTRDMYRLKKGRITVSQLIDNVSAGLTGTAVFAIGYVFYNLGWLGLGGGDDDSEREKAFKSAIGEQRYSIRFDGGSYTIDWAVPASLPLIMGAEVARYFETEREGSIFNIGPEAMTSMFDPIFELTMLSSLTNVLTSFKTGSASVGDAGIEAVASYIGQFVPTISAQIARIIDPVKRSTYAPKNSYWNPAAENIVRRIMNKIPWLTKYNAPIVNVMGEEELQDEGNNLLERIFFQMLSTGSYKGTETSAPEDVILKLYNEVMTGDVLPKVTPSSFSYNGITRVLDSYERAQFAKTMGEQTKDMIVRADNSRFYGSATTAEKIDLVAKIYNYAYDLAKNGLVAMDGDSRFKKISTADYYGGLDPVQFFVGELLYEQTQVTEDKSREYAYIDLLRDYGYDAKGIKYMLENGRYSYKVSDADMAYISRKGD